MDYQATDTLQIVLSNDVTMEFIIDHGFYRGLKNASLSGRTFLVHGRGQTPYFVTPEGIAYYDFKLRRHEKTSEGFILECQAIGRTAPVQQNTDVFYFPIIGTSLDSQVSDTLRVRISARTLEVGGEIYRGFEITYEFISDCRKIHWIYESVSMAPDGGISKARVMAQNMTARQCQLEAVLERDSFYSTAETYDTVCIQSPPRGGGSQLFDLVQGEKLSVVSFFESADSGDKALKANLQKQPGEDFVTVSDFHYGNLSSSFESAPRVVLAGPRAGSGREDAINRWTKWFEYTTRSWCSELGIRKTDAVPTLSLEGTGAGGIDAGTTYPDLLKVWAKRLDWVEQQGFKAILLHTPEWISAANRPNLVFKGNNCCPWEFRLSEFLGGNEGMRIFCDACHARKIKVFVWIAGHLHRESPHWKAHPEWIVRAPNQSPWDGHYAIIHSVSFAHGAGGWMLKDLGELREKTGVDGVWFDSFANLTMQPINWQSPLREPNAPGVLRFLGDLSRIGYEIMIEGMSQLGVSSWGGLQTGEIEGHEEVLLNTNMRYFLRRHWRGWQDNPRVTRDLYFKLLSSRAPISVWIEEFLEKAETFPLDLPEWFAPLTCAYNKVAPRMYSRMLMPDGVLWLDSNQHPSAYFAFEASNLPIPDVHARDLTTDAPCMNMERCIAGHIYEII